eukprot:359321-Chlamydomonas_euryale.AAC.3
MPRRSSHAGAGRARDPGACHAWFGHARVRRVVAHSSVPHLPRPQQRRTARAPAPCLQVPTRSSAYRAACAFAGAAPAPPTPRLCRRQSAPRGRSGRRHRALATSASACPLAAPRARREGRRSRQHATTEAPTSPKGRGTRRRGTSSSSRKLRSLRARRAAVRNPAARADSMGAPSQRRRECLGWGCRAAACVHAPLCRRRAR